MHDSDLKIIAPYVLGGEINEAEVFVSAVWLWMHSASHRNAPLQMLSTLLLPAIVSRQFVLASEGGKPVFYLAWAGLSEAAEKRYLKNSPQCMSVEDWTSGRRIWLLDWVAPFGHTQRMRSVLARRLFPGWCARSLYHRGKDKGLRILNFHGIAVAPEEARFWSENNPPAIDTTSRDQE